MSALTTAKRWWLPAAAALLLAVCAVKYVGAQGQEETSGEDPYRVELVQNNPYKLQTGLNNLGKKGWVLVSAIPRSDGRVLLILRRD